MLVGSNPHRLEIVSVLAVTSSLLNLLIGNLEAREIASDDQSQAVPGCEVALVVESEIGGRCVIRIGLGNDGIQIAARHAARSTASKGVPFPNLLCLRERVCGVE